jgi:hypothetical protein
MNNLHSCAKEDQKTWKKNNKDNSNNLKDLTSEANYKSYSQKKPHFFNKNFSMVNNVMSFILGSYIILTTIMYLAVHFNFGTFIKSKTFLLEYDQILFHNLFINLSFGVMIFFNYLAYKNDMISFYFIIDISLFTLNYFFVSEMTAKDFFLFEFLKILKIFLISIGVSLGLYIVYHYLSNLNHMRNFLSNNFSFEEIYHEVCLRTDMIKFSYNAFIIRFKLHKIIPSLLYSRDAFYYRTCKKPVRERSDQNSKLMNSNYKYDNKKAAFLNESESVDININIEDEKQKFISKGSSAYAHLSTQGEY